MYYPNIFTYFKIGTFSETKDMLIRLSKCFTLNKVNNVKESIKNKVPGYTCISFAQFFPYQTS